MKIAIMSTMPADTYSGGRYCAWVMAECLAHKKNKVYFITNNIPIFYSDFECYEHHKSVQLLLTSDFDVQIEDEQLDYVILVPNQDKNDYFYIMTRKFARTKNAKLVLLSFETPNWFNAYSPVPRDERMWEFWKAACEDGCLVLCISGESEKYAKEYYLDQPEYLRFAYWYPAINTKAADSVEAEKEKRIIFFARFQDQHKGGADIFQLLGKYLKGYTLVFVIGNGKIDKIYLDKLCFFSERYGFKYELKPRLSDKEKFMEIKRAQFMLFPSYFEGYGYPPIEAQYCDTLCIAYDLPVLRETCGNGILYCKRGDIYAMREALEAAVGNYKPRDFKANILKCADFEKRADDIQKVLESFLNDDYRNPAHPSLRISKLQKPPVETKHTLKSAIRGFVRRLRAWTKKVRGVLFMREMPIHLGENNYDAASGRLFLKGWYLIWRDIQEIEVLNGYGSVLGHASFGLERKDIYEKYPQYGTTRLGYEFNQIVQPKDVSSDFKIRVICSDGKVTCESFKWPG